jgi:PAS domain S-box-containing protein
VNFSILEAGNSTGIVLVKKRKLFFLPQHSVSFMNKRKSEIFNAVPDSAFAVLSVDSESLILGASDRLAEALGYKPEELAGQALSTILSEPRDISALAADLESNAAAPTTLELINAHGDIIHTAAFYGAPAAEAEPHYLLFHLASDIPAQRSLTRDSALMTVRPDGTIESVSSTALDILGWREEDLAGRRFSSALAYPFVKNHENQLAEFLQSRNRRMSVSLASKGGHLHTHPLIITAAGDNGELLTVHLDTSKQSQGQSRLKETIIRRILSRSHHAESLEDLIRGCSLLLKEFSGADAVGVRLKRGDNFPYYEISGFSNSFSVAENEICQKNPDERAGCGNLQCFCGSVLEQRKVRPLKGYDLFGSFVTNNALELSAEIPSVADQIDVRGKCLHDGYLSVALVPLKLRGEVHGLLQFNSFETNAFPEELLRSLEEIASELVIAIDNFVKREELSQLNQTLEQKNQALEKLNQELRMFAAEVTHDLRSPLNQIRQYLTMLENTWEENPGEIPRHYLDRVNTLIPQMQEMVTSFITLTRISETNPSLFKIDLSTMVKRSIEEEQMNFPDCTVEATVEEGATVLADPGLMRIAITNLVNNGIKYSADKGTAALEFGINKQSECPEFFIADNGIGIPANEMHNLFKPFQRLSNSKGYMGTGIGLSSVKRALERMGGTIRCESEEGRGTSFYFSFKRD